jgi:hypothetical protein
MVEFLMKATRTSVREPWVLRNAKEAESGLQEGSEDS